jgi:hypothetical protein
MASTANGNKHVVFARKSHARDYIGGPGTTRNDRWPTVDHRIRNGSRSIVALLAGAE